MCARAARVCDELGHYVSRWADAPQHTQDGDAGSERAAMAAGRCARVREKRCGAQARGMMIRNIIT
eukprot:2959196-Pleurochrysis_carterae.AAC.1